MSRSSESLSLIPDNQLSSVKTLFSVLRERARHACHDLHIDPKGGIKRGEWATTSWQMAIRWDSVSLNTLIMVNNGHREIGLVLPGRWFPQKD